ncbi:MAG: hypothetical protein A3E00_08690 [Curvibacter sp. RIFCSPHIGHO2_12_FULL_63_18]|nr:MAG: hypothetical protein A2037_03455 [Curvibacter sp. GWA2_63_95]OGP03680.1 MAG: hypothetical protein A3E00_08690 [Curvibacter sp. RIFCSPHIGHO2_12_FULL_63_18]
MVLENGSLRGFEHKVHLDKYSPFENTFFFDSDVLLFKDLRPVTDSWGHQSYTAIGGYMVDGFSSFGLDRQRVLAKIGKDKLVVIDGAGHAFFTKPACQEVFDLARHVTQNHAEYAGNIPYADEDVMDIVMTILNLAPAPGDGFFSRHLTAVPGTLQMDATVGKCRMIANYSGLPVEPCMMHFASNEAPFPYAKQLHKLFKLNGVSTKGLYSEALSDFYTMEILWPLKARLKRLLKRVGIQLAK